MGIYTTSITRVKQNERLIKDSHSLLITRSDRAYSHGMKQLGIIHSQKLAPSWDLFKEAQDVKQGNNFDSWYDEVYVSTYVRELNNPDSVALLRELVQRLNNNEDIVLICFCTKERCHRHIVSDILHRLTKVKVEEI